MKWGVEMRYRYPGSCRWSMWRLRKIFLPDGRQIFGFKKRHDVVAYVSAVRNHDQQWRVVHRTELQLRDV